MGANRISVDPEKEHGHYPYLGADPPLEDPKIEGTLEVINKLKNAKALVSDNIPAELSNMEGLDIHNYTNYSHLYGNKTEYREKATKVK